MDDKLDVTCVELAPEEIFVLELEDSGPLDGKGPDMVSFPV